METINKLQGTRITRIYSAKFYHFKYITEAPDNKWFDVFPLVFSLLSDSISMGKIGNTIQGLNFHYLPIHLRIPLLNLLRDVKPDMIKYPIAFVRFFNNLMWTQRKWRAAQACFKKYKIENIKGGKIIRIEQPDWENSLNLLNTDKFVTSTFGKVSKLKVWTDTLKKMRTR